MSAITWYVVTDSESISAGSKHDLGGYYSSVSDRIVLADTANLPGSVIRHEMLHALLGPLVHGHPRDAFLGSCAGTVACIGSCITNAGPPPSFSWVATCLRAIQLCGNLGYEMRDERANDMASATRFAPGETKRFVVDFQVGRTADASWSLPAGPYAFTGYYGGRYPGLTRSTPDTAMVGP